MKLLNVYVERLFVKSNQDIRCNTEENQFFMISLHHCGRHPSLTKMSIKNPLRPAGKPHQQCDD